MADAPKPGRLIWDSPEFAKVYASVETTTGPYAQGLLDRTIMLDLKHDKDLAVLDLACGTGIVSAKLMDMLNNAEVHARVDLTCSDFADAMVDAVSQRIKACGWPNAKAIKADAMDTKLPSAEYSHVLMNFGPMLLPDWRAGLREMHRMLRPGGMLGLSSWKELGWYVDVREAFSTDPQIPALPDYEKMRNNLFPGGRWHDEEWVELTVKTAGFGAVSVEAVPHTTTWANVDETLPMMTGLMGFVTGGCWTKEQQDQYAEQAKVIFEKYMREKYGDGEIRWDWVAILTTARKPVS